MPTGVTQRAAEVPARLSALRLVSFVTAERDSVRVGLLSPDAHDVIDLTPLGFADAHEALAQVQTLRQTAGAIVHGAARSVFPVADVFLMAAVPLARSVVQYGAAPEPTLSDPTTLHGPGSHLNPAEAASARVGLATVVGETVPAASDVPDEVLDRALVGTAVVLGWEQPDAGGGRAILPGAVGPYVAVPRRRPESLACTLIAPLSAVATHPDVQRSAAAPSPEAFDRLARAVLQSHTLHAGDLLIIFPDAATADADAWGAAPPLSGSWLRASAPGLGTLSLAVR